MKGRKDKTGEGRTTQRGRVDKKEGRQEGTYGRKEGRKER
jgi:hypothetical protein